MLQPGGVSHGNLKVLARASRPLLGRARIGLQQVSDRQAGAQQSAVTAIEMEELGGRPVVQATHRAAVDCLANRPGAETLTFKRQECQLVHGIERSKP